MKRMGLALVLGVGLGLLPALAEAGPLFAGGSQMGGGQTMAAPGTASKGAPGTAGKSGVRGVRQPCDARVVRGFGSFGGFRSVGPSEPTYLTVDAVPLDAQVFLDGRPLGTAGDLVARAFALAPGRHAIEIVAPGFRPYVAQFSVAPGSFPFRLRVALSPQ